MSASIWAPGADIINVDAESSNLSQVFTAIASQTLFTLTAFSYTVGSSSIAVYRGGQRLIKGVDWVEITSTSIAIQGIALAAGETIEVVAVLGAASDASLAAAASAASAAASAASAALADVTSTNTRTLTNKSIGDNLRLTGTGARITGDFSNATIANRVMFQTSTANDNSSIGVVPNGAATVSDFTAYGTTDVPNSSYGMMRILASNVMQLESGKNGTGTYLPMTFYTGGSERMRIGTSGDVGIGLSPLSGQGCFQSYKLVTGGLPATSGASDPNQVAAINSGAVQLSFGAITAGHNWIQSRARDNFALNYDLYLQPNGGNTLHVGPNGGLGYGTGAGGTVTQATSKSTAVTLNKPCGRITVNASALNSLQVAVFNVNNTLVTQNDTIILTCEGAAVGNYRVELFYIGSAAFGIRITNLTGGTLSESFNINFAIIKGASA